MTESNNLGGDFLYQWTFPRVRFQEHFSYGKKLASISQNIRSLCWRHLCKKSWWCWWQAVECLHLHPPFRTNRQVFSLSVVINWEAVTIKGLQQCHCQDHEQTHSDLSLYMTACLKWVSFIAILFSTLNWESSKIKRIFFPTVIWTNHTASKFHNLL